ncbi:ABC transporter substrate-binding protein [Streptomyces viridiviolaceus]|uniref:ABC transporter substrate-binding protein n=1 Tax=Streptomyces viridiviolaceus TaxID=68282 RepID=A0ABW2E531_9ACTN|nr:ABC transporter substrate-binding protein [Streptomyces viridiviolaceus]
MSRARGFVTTATAIALALSVTSCAESKRDSGSKQGRGGGTFAYATSDDPASLDPVFTQDMQSGLVAAQVFEGLTGVASGDVRAEPRLATGWTVGKDGLAYRFTLREGVTFHDGAPFDAEAVCFNFDRWYNLPRTAQSANFAYYYGYFFHGFATGPTADSALYKSCTAAGAHEAVIELKKPFAGLIDALTMPQFAMQSPKALKKYQDDGASNPNTTAYSTAHPVGTGPFTLESWDRGKEVVMERNDDYWGAKAKVDRLVFVSKPDSKERVAALRNGEVNGADSVSPTDVGTLDREGFRVETRRPFTLAFLGFNQKRKPLDDPRVRQAIAHAIDRKAVIGASFPKGTVEADQWLPKGMQGWAEDVPEYANDPEKSRRLLREAGAVGTSLELNYQSGGGSACLPAPADTLNILRKQIEAVGLKIKPVAIPSSEFSDRIYGTSDHDIEMSCWIGQVNLADSFIGLAFGFPSLEWGFDDPELYKDLAHAQTVPGRKEQNEVYAALSKRIMQILPGVPFASSPSSIGLDPEVSGFVASPISQEMFHTVSLG